MRIHLLFVCFSFSAACFSQVSTLVYVSVQGTWDKTKDHGRAQFASNNKIINNYFAANKDLSKTVIRAGDNVRGIGELVFKVKVDGTIDSLILISGVKTTIDEEMIKIVEGMSGKWVVGDLDGVKRSETIRLWYSIYRGDVRKKQLSEFLDLSASDLAKGDFTKAVKNANEALYYDPINTQAIFIKAQALAESKRLGDACEWLSSNAKYKILKVDSLVTAFCKK